MSLARAMAWNSLVQVGGRVIGLVASMTFNAILIRHLGIATYGQLTAASVYVGLFMILGESGLYLVAVRRAMQDPAARARILGTALGLRLLWTIVPLGLAFVVAQFIPAARFPTYQPTVKLCIGIMAFNEYIRLLCQFLTAVFRMHLRMDLAVIGEVGSRLVALIGILVVAAGGGGLMATAVAFLVANAVNLGYAWITARRLESFRPQLDPPLVSGILRESVVVAGVLILSLLRVQVGTFLLSLMRPAADVGIYGVALKVHEVLVTFPGLFIALLYPVLSRLATEDAERLRRTFQRTFDVMLVAGVGLGLVVVVFAPALAGILGEPRAAAPMRVLALALPSAFLGMSFSHLVLAEGKAGLILKLYAFFALASLAANWLLIPRFSYFAVAAMTVGMEACVLLGLGAYWVVQRGLRLELRTLWAVPLALVLGLAARLAVGRVLPGQSVAANVLVLFAGGTLLVAAYVAASWKLGLLQTDVLRAFLPGRAAAAPPESS